jgi:hypothetical protein
MPFTDWANFAAIYNDVAAHPQLADVAYALGVSYQTVRNKTVIARKLREAWTYETSWFNENDPSSREYDQALTKYLCFGQMKIGPNFVFCAEMNTLPTANAPLNDLVTYTRGRWGVFPHAKRQLKTVPTTDPTVQPHQVMTTGAVTRPKVIPRKAGVKSIFHQVIGAVIVEFDKDGDIFCRHITGDEETGAFYDLECYVSNGQVSRPDVTVDAITFMDIHRAKLTPAMDAALFSAPGSVLNVLRPAHAFYHDVFDNERRNHHNAKDNALSYELATRGRESVLGEVAECALFLASVQRPETKTIVVESNHDLALERYVREGRYRMDGINVLTGLQLETRYLQYRELVGQKLDAHEPVPSFSLLEYAVRLVAGETVNGVEWVHDGKSRVINGVECGHHGFRGANGAKGTVSGFARLGRKMSIGDKHTPEIDDGVYVAGVAELQHGYNKGPSGWCRTMIVQYLDGKRTLVTLQNGEKWRG